VATSFRRLKNVGKSYDAQGFIYFSCKNYRCQTQAMKDRIDRLCKSAGGEYAPALKEYMTTDADWRGVCDRYYIAHSTLDRIRTRFYDMW
jgi:glutathione peroxidase-family protein